MKVLADTHTLVWALTEPTLLSRKAHKLLSGAEVLVSIANLWELILKKDKKDALLSDPLPWWDKYVVPAGILTLAIRQSHIMEIAHFTGFIKTRLIGF